MKINISKSIMKFAVASYADTLERNHARCQQLYREAQENLIRAQANLDAACTLMVHSKERLDGFIKVAKEVG